MRLSVPTALIATIWHQVNEGLHKLRRGGAEVGGLFLGRRSQTNSIVAEAAVPIPIEYHFGSSFRLSPSDINGVEALIASLQKDPSRAVVGFYRSRTRNDGLSEERDSAVLDALEQSHASFASDFHYFVVFSPLSKLAMTASASFRAEEGWEAWQHATLVMNQSSVLPSELVAPPAAPQVSIGKAVKISGPIYSKGDLYIDGDVEGSIELQEHRLTIGPNGRVRSNVKAREVVIMGTLQGQRRCQRQTGSPQRR